MTGSELKEEFEIIKLNRNIEEYMQNIKLKLISAGVNRDILEGNCIKTRME